MRDDGAFGLALLLAALAGWIDVAGLGSGGVFLSFMSGNTAHMAVSLTHRDWQKALSFGAIVALFVAGVVAGEGDWCGLYAALWVSLAAGSAIGALALSISTPGALAMAAAYVAVLAVMAAPDRR